MLNYLRDQRQILNEQVWSTEGLVDLAYVKGQRFALDTFEASLKQAIRNLNREDGDEPISVN